MARFEAALVVVYNHKYEKNISVVEAIYGHRFRHIFHLVPFYSGCRPNVLAVYANSHFFQGYLAQGFGGYFRPEFTHYVFIADDLLLNPEISGDNYHSLLSLDAGACYISRLDSVPQGSGYWSNYRSGILFDPFGKPGIEIGSDLPDRHEAARRLARHGVVGGPFTFEQVYGHFKFPGSMASLEHDVRRFGQYALDRLLYKADLKATKYPLARSYSDIAVVSADCIKQFCRYCGIFSATELFAELAIPTALALVAERIVKEEDIALRGKALWTAADMKELDGYDRQLGGLLRDFPRSYLYLHPIKLSQWSIEDL